jgi:hypothetical protein
MASIFTRFTCRKSQLFKLSALSAAFAIMGCNADNLASLRVIHASPDAPEVNVNVNRRSVISGLDYAQSSGNQWVLPGNRSVMVDAVLPNGEQTVISVPKFKFDKGQQYNIIAVDRVADIAPLVVASSSVTPTASEVSLSIVHASPDAPAVDVYLSAPGTDVLSESVMPNFTFDFKDPAFDVGAVPASQYDITVMLAGTKTVAYDIASVDLSPFSGQSLLVAALSTTNATQQAASPIKLLVATDDAQVTLLDQDTVSGVRVAHLSPDADEAANGAVEVLVTNGALGVSDLELIDAFSYTELAPPLGNPPFPLTADGQYVLAPVSDDYTFDVAVDEGPVVFTSEVTELTQGSEVTVIAGGNVLSTPGFDLFLTEDDNRSVITQASVKIAHFAPAAGTVDVFVTPAGAYTVADVQAGHAGEPLLDGFAYSEITDYVDVVPGDYDVRIVPEATGVVAINQEGLTLSPGLVATAIARQPNSAGSPSGEPNDFGLVLLVP